jgi:alpha-D-ribose 1-methylphosphonate 5-triphosphate synthase subunit PhnL
MVMNSTFTGQHSNLNSHQTQPDFPAHTQLKAENLHKGFTLHNQGGVRLPVLEGVSLTVKAGECIALVGASGSGKSTFMRSLYGNYRIDAGNIWVNHEENWVNLPALRPHELMAVRQKTMGYVSQFLRVIPRVPAIDVAADPLMELGFARETAYEKIQYLFERLNLPQRLWQLSPTTFSGGEKQRVNVARALSVNYPIMLLDEPTSALDADNREVVMQFIEERKAYGCAMIGIFHDDEVRNRVCDRTLKFG